MKLILPLVTLVIFSSCGTITKISNESDKTKVITETTLATKKISNRLKGDWGIYVHYGAYCNACPRILFNDSKNATLTLPSGKKEIYSWYCTKENLNLKYVGDENLHPYFTNKEYKMAFKQKDKYVELTLSYQSGGVPGQYVLRK